MVLTSTTLHYNSKPVPWPQYNYKDPNETEGSKYNFNAAGEFLKWEQTERPLFPLQFQNPRPSRKSQVQIQCRRRSHLNENRLQAFCAHYNANAPDQT